MEGVQSIQKRGGCFYPYVSTTDLTLEHVKLKTKHNSNKYHHHDHLASSKLSNTKKKQNQVLQRLGYLQHESVDHLPGSSPYFRGVNANPKDGLLKAPSKSARSSRLGRDVVEALYDFMDMSWSNKEERLPVQTNLNGGPRWTSDDADAYEEQQSPGRLPGIDYYNTPSRGLRSRLARR
ncbi:ELYS-like domain-containing protein [Artemisia annua]|uniref:ELYS-like domain-containing protein n=1 Tax=Artemisia annua TaxID=35608 RepID=A0A2U1KF78_ARTAN|nr:ELYS-like domain-containing protein [Artemisia annua]